MRSAPLVTSPPVSSGPALAASRLPPPPPVTPPCVPVRSTSAPPRLVDLLRHCCDSDIRRIYSIRRDFGGGGGRRGWWSRRWEDSPEVMVMAAVAASTATAAFARKLHSPGVINSWRTKHLPQGQRFRRQWCESGGSGDRKSVV